MDKPSDEYRRHPDGVADEHGARIFQSETMTNTMKSGDIIFGAVGTSATFGLTQINLTLGCIAGVLTVIVMLLKLRKEWRDRDK